MYLCHPIRTNRAGLEYRLSFLSLWWVGEDALCSGGNWDYLPLNNRLKGA